MKNALDKMYDLEVIAEATRLHTAANRETDGVLRRVMRKRVASLRKQAGCVSLVEMFEVAGTLALGGYNARRATLAKRMGF